MHIKSQVPLREYTTLKAGGRAAFFVCVTTREALTEALRWAKERGLPCFILGGGSNVLFSDDGFDGLVIKIDLRGIVYEKKGETVFVTVSAGEPWDAFVSETVKKGLWGLENLSAIPGSTGAVPVQNVGAYGVEVRDKIDCVTVLNTQTGTIEKYSNEMCAFAYRDSIFKHTRGRSLVVLDVRFRLSTTPCPVLSYKDVAEHFKTEEQPSLAGIRKAIILIRRKKFPDLLKHGTAGSFFKNPIVEEEQAAMLKNLYPELPFFEVPEGKKIPLAWILDRVLNLRGFHKKNVWLFENQPLVFVTKEGVSSAEIISLAREVQKRVHEKIKIHIDPEVTIVGGTLK